MSVAVGRVVRLVAKGQGMRVTTILIGLGTLASGTTAAQAADPGQLLRGTPWWAYVLLVVLIGLGVQAARPREVGLRRLLLVPLMFVTWGLAALAARLGAGLVPLAAWAAAAGLGAALGAAVVRFDGAAIDHVRGTVALPGSWVPLIRNVGLFGAKYALTAAAAINPTLPLAPWDAAVSGLSAGFFAAWLVRLAGMWRRAPGTLDIAGVRP